MRATFSGPLTAALLLLLLMGVLAGCDYPDPAFQQFQRKFGWTEERLLASGWVPPRDMPPDAVWCYETLADPDCFDEPLPARERTRLIGAFEPPSY